MSQVVCGGSPAGTEIIHSYHQKVSLTYMATESIVPAYQIGSFS